MKLTTKRAARALMVVVVVTTTTTHLLLYHHTANVRALTPPTPLTLVSLLQHLARGLTKISLLITSILVIQDPISPGFQHANEGQLEEALNSLGLPKGSTEALVEALEDVVAGSSSDWRLPRSACGEGGRSIRRTKLATSTLGRRATSLGGDGAAGVALAAFWRGRDGDAIAIGIIA
jgi:hypothetical protein